MGKGENAGFPQCFQKFSFSALLKVRTVVQRFNPFPKRPNVDSSKLKEFAHDNFKLDENGRKFSKQVEKHCGKRRNCLLQAISPFLTVFS